MARQQCSRPIGALVSAALGLACAFPKMEVGPEPTESAGRDSATVGGKSATEGGAMASGTASTDRVATAGVNSTASTSTGTVTATGGAATTVLGTNVGGTTAVAGTTGVGIASGCTGSLETPLASKGLCVAKMVTISGPSGTTGYGIDATEVTRGQYEAWLATNPPPPAKSDVSCASNASYAAAMTCMASSHVCKTGCNDHPAVCIDWCDAQAYCAAVEKRLCGKIGGGSNAFADLVNADASQWYRACSAAGTNSYPYGNTYAQTTCDGNEYWPSTTANTTVPVGTLTSCQSPVASFGGVYDLSGNVVEWEDSCASTGENSSCRLRGGAFEDNGNTLTCSYAFSYARNTANLRIGFRCCSA